MFGYSTGLSALNAARLAIDLVGQNLANVNTPGYSRGRVNFRANGASVMDNALIGGGVRADSIERMTDRLLLGRARVQSHEVGRRQTLFEAFKDIELAFAEPSENAISGLLNGLFNDLSGLATTPDDLAVRNTLVQSGANLAEQFRYVRTQLGAAGNSVQGHLVDATANVNRIGDALTEINKQLAQAQGSGQPPHVLLDRQDALLDELAQFVDLSVQNLSGGRIAVSIAGQMLVGPSQAAQLTTRTKADGKLGVFLGNSPNELNVAGGVLRGLLDLDETGVEAQIADLDELAHTLIFEMNRVHSTGLPAAGGFTSLTGSNQIQDSNSNGSFLDEQLGDAGLPFDVSDGALLVTVTDTDGNITARESITVDPTGSVQDLVTAVSSVDGLNATVDGTGRFRITAAAGRQFHFAPTLSTNPNSAGTFGSDSGQVSGTVSEPFALADGEAINISVDGAPTQTITFNAAQFTDITQATADEVVAVINTTLTGASARNVDGRVVIESSATGPSSSIHVSNASGTPSATMGLSNLIDFGSDFAVDVTLGGAYEGDLDDTLTFRPTGIGTVGVTPGLGVEVLDSQGQVIATLDVGEGYAPGDPLPIGNGITAAFGPGSLSDLAGDSFDVEVTAESDTSDVLVALGLNGFFSGHDASTIDIPDELLDNANLLAVGFAGAAGDNRNVLRMLDLRDQSISGLGDLTLEQRYNVMIADVGRNTSRTGIALESQQALLDTLNNRIDQVRGVSVDEELANLQRFEQAYEAAARYITAVNDVSQILFSI